MYTKFDFPRTDHPRYVVHLPRQRCESVANLTRVHIILVREINVTRKQRKEPSHK